eukprot:TRINITY_DN27724_c0_g1_i3.p1 TRINITY_DN27724_c0_g1~~TRINITY_DN27724_c0_g1_i3.p1  ORF type:complete len:307 (-),score=43.64 TRINITY_DN27724_c0_g1_i3:850-1770(-)
MKQLGLLLLSCTIAGFVECANWGYGEDEHGADHWSETFSECAGQSQSPIDFKSAELTARSEMALKLLNYNQLPYDVQAINNGHTLKLEFNTSHEMFMYGGGLCTAYKLAQVHFHWGQHKDTGSEHTVEGQHYPIEIHFVHYKAKHDDLSSALQNAESDTLAVLGIFGEISEEDNPMFAPLVDNLEALHSDIGQFYEIPAFSASNMLPSDLSRFYRYSGSLTTPGCNQIVTWTVNQTPVKISSAQLEKLRALQQSNGDQLVDNYRPVQAINGREILDVITYRMESGGTTNLAQISLLSILIILLKQF